MSSCDEEILQFRKSFFYPIGIFIAIEKKCNGVHT